MPKNATENETENATDDTPKNMTKKQKIALLIIAFVIAPVTLAATGAYFVARALDPDQGKTVELCRSVQAGQAADLAKLTDAAKTAGLNAIPKGKDGDFELTLFGGGFAPLKCWIAAKEGKITQNSTMRF